MWTNVPKARQCVRLKDFATFAKECTLVSGSSTLSSVTYNTWMPTKLLEKNCADASSRVHTFAKICERSDMFRTITIRYAV